MADGDGHDQWDRRRQDINWKSKFEQRLSALEGTQTRILEIVERLDVESHDAVVRIDERKRIRKERWDRIREFGSVLGYLGAGVAILATIMALAGG